MDTVANNFQLFMSHGEIVCKDWRLKTLQVHCPSSLLVLTAWIINGDIKHKIGQLGLNQNKQAIVDFKQWIFKQSKAQHMTVRIGYTCCFKKCGCLLLLLLAPRIFSMFTIKNWVISCQHTFDSPNQSKVRDSNIKKIIHVPL
jgi:hypothetical protein